MKNYEKYFAKITLDFNKMPEYDSESEIGDSLNSDIVVKLTFYSDSSKAKRSQNQYDFVVSMVDVSESLKNLQDMIEHISMLNNKETSSNIIPFCSIDGEPEDLGIWWTFTREDPYLFIQFDFRNKDMIIIKTNTSDFNSSIKDFIDMIRGIIKNMKYIPENYRTYVLDKISFLDASLVQKA
jgi:hypothetical protein